MFLYVLAALYGAKKNEEEAVVGTYLKYLPRKYPIEKSIVLKRKLYLGDATNQILIEFS